MVQAVVAHAHLFAILQPNNLRHPAFNTDWHVTDVEDFRIRAQTTRGFCDNGCRAGEPFTLSPTQLFSTLMITSGTMTHRLKALEKRGFICRLANPQDARSMLVALTPEGRERIDRAVETHVENERQLLAGLTAEQRQRLNDALAGLMRLLEED